MSVLKFQRVARGLNTVADSLQTIDVSSCFLTRISTDKLGLFFKDMLSSAAYRTPPVIG